MQRAVSGLVSLPEHLLVDGLPVSAFSLPQTAIVDGDARSFSIAAASVIAKITRDRMMMSWHEEFPVYEFARTKGMARQSILRNCARTDLVSSTPNVCAGGSNLSAA